MASNLVKKPDRVTQEILQEIGRRIAQLDEDTFVMNPPNENAMYLSSVKIKHKSNTGNASWRFISEPVEYAVHRSHGVATHMIPYDMAAKRLPLHYGELFYPPWLEEWLMNNPLVLATVLYVSSIHVLKSCNEKHQRPIATSIASTVESFRGFMQHQVNCKYQELLALNYKPESLDNNYEWTVTDTHWQAAKAAILDAKMLIAEWVYCSFNNNPMEWAAMLVKYEGAIQQCNEQNLIPRVQAGYVGLFSKSTPTQQKLIDNIIPVYKTSDTDRIAKEIVSEQEHVKSLQCKAKPVLVQDVLPVVKHETMMDTISLPKLNIPFINKNNRS